MEYVIKRVSSTPQLCGDWEGRAWSRANTLSVDRFRQEGSTHRPRTNVRVLYDDTALYGIFRVEDRYVTCIRTGFQNQVCKDSCVEFFVQPKPEGGGYFNFEFNCGGAFLTYFIRDWQRGDRGFRDYTPLTEEDSRGIAVYHSMPSIVKPEIQEDVTWTLEFRIPLFLIAKYAGVPGALSGQCWKGNFYKCAGDSTHPHYGAWSPVDAVNFHMPRCFGELRFE